MAGRARHKAITEELERRTQETFDPEPDDDPQPTTLDYICHRVEGRTSTTKLAKELEDALGFPFEYAALMRYLRDMYGESTTDEAISSARSRSAHAYAEESVDIVDEKAETGIDVQRAASRSKARQWLAGRYNSKYAQQSNTTVNVSVGSLHLDALRAPIAVVARPAGEVTAPVTPAVAGSRARLIEPATTSPSGPASVAGNVTPGTADNAQPASVAAQD